MKSADDEAETGPPPPRAAVEGRLPPSKSEDTGGGNAAVPAPKGDAAAAARVVSLPPSSSSVSSIANLTAALMTSTIPLAVLQNGVALNASLMVPQSTLQNVNPSLAEFKGQGAKILPNDLGLHLVTDPSFRPPVVIGMPAASMAASVKRETDDESLSETDDDSNSNQEWALSGGRAHLDDGAIDYSVTAPNCGSTTVGAETATKKMRTSTGSRRRNYRDAKLTPEEEERRKMRRERNKLAAAKCRQKRVDQTNQLLAETQVLEEEQSRLEEEIKKYQQQKEELEFVLEAHRLQCGLGKQTTLAPQVSSSSASAPLRLPSESVPPVKSEHAEEAGKDLKALTVQGARVVPTMQRPNSFPMVSRPLPVGITQVFGIPISTPSSGMVITLGLDSMLDGHTGLTPITGVPSIVAQTPQNPTSDVVPPSSDTITPATTALMSL